MRASSWKEERRRTLHSPAPPVQLGQPPSRDPSARRRLRRQCSLLRKVPTRVPCLDNIGSLEVANNLLTSQFTHLAASAAVAGYLRGSVTMGRICFRTFISPSLHVVHPNWEL